LDHFAINATDLVCLDVGASTGGFTDCLLQRGAQRVIAIDVGHNQVAWKIRCDPRVEVREGLNARVLSPELIGTTVQLAVVDVSFISLTLVLPPILRCVEHGGLVVALIKPQFELEPNHDRARYISPGSVSRRIRAQRVPYSGRHRRLPLHG